VTVATTRGSRECLTERKRRLSRLWVPRHGFQLVPVVGAILTERIGSCTGKRRMTHVMIAITTANIQECCHAIAVSKGNVRIQVTVGRPGMT